MLFAGCGGGGGSQLARRDAAPLLALASRIPGESPCAQARDIAKLRARATALINARRVPQTLQDPLSSGVNALVELKPPCLPSVPAATVSPPAQTIVPAHGKKHGHGHGHGHGKDDD